MKTKLCLVIGLSLVGCGTEKVQMRGTETSGQPEANSRAHARSVALLEESETGGQVDTIESKQGGGFSGEHAKVFGVVRKLTERMLAAMTACLQNSESAGGADTSASVRLQCAPHAVDKVAADAVHAIFQACFVPSLFQGGGRQHKSKEQMAEEIRNSSKPAPSPDTRPTYLPAPPKLDLSSEKCVSAVTVNGREELTRNCILPAHGHGAWLAVVVTVVAQPEAACPVNRRSLELA